MKTLVKSLNDTVNSNKLITIILLCFFVVLLNMRYDVDEQEICEKNLKYVRSYPAAIDTQKIYHQLDNKCRVTLTYPITSTKDLVEMRSDNFLNYLSFFALVVIVILVSLRFKIISIDKSL